ncbi:Uncharacterised protein [Vibrio cholerae]|nr:Uncharacterised protein [Vibrio cholerae]
MCRGQSASADRPVLRSTQSSARSPAAVAPVRKRLISYRSPIV